MAKSLERPLTNESALAQFVSDTCVNRTGTSLIIGSSNYAYSHEKGLYRAYLTWCNHSDFYPVSLATFQEKIVIVITYYLKWKNVYTRYSVLNTSMWGLQIMAKHLPRKIGFVVACLLSLTVAASDSTFTQDELYTPLVNAYESDLLDKRAALSKCVTTACAVYAQLDITRLNNKLAEIKAIYAQMIEAEARLKLCPVNHVTRCINPEKALVQSLGNEIYAAKEGK